MKSIYGIFGIMAMIIADNDLNRHIVERERIREIENERMREKKRERMREIESLSKIERNIANGLKEFFYGENSVWAINKKNADRKARNNHWL